MSRQNNILNVKLIHLDSTVYGSGSVYSIKFTLKYNCLLPALYTS